MRKTLSLLFVFTIFFTFMQTSCSTGSHAKSNSPFVGFPQPRLLIFISDLHMGIGHKKLDHKTIWHNTEDFRWEKEFKQFLQFISEEGKGKTDLIIVGDMFELWQSAEMKCDINNGQLECKVLDCEHFSPELGCTEDEALRRLKHIINQHNKVFEALSNFVNDGDNHIVILPGNHDAALLFPKVAKTVQESISGSKNHVHIVQSGIWISNDGRIFADHGHFFDKVNRFENWPKPFIEIDGKRYLYRPSGEQLVQQFYNQYEELFPIIDNISSEGLGVRLAITALDSNGVSVAINKFFKFLLFQQSWSQAIAFLGEEKEHTAMEWDIKEIREKEGVEFLLDCFDTDDPIRNISQKAAEKGELKIALSDFEDEEIRMICDFKSRLASSQRKAGSPKIVDECPVVGGKLGHIMDKLLNRYNSNVKKHLLQTYKNLKASRPDMKYFNIYIHGHTHKPHPGIPLMIDESIKWEITFYNTGAFQRLATPEQIEEIKKKRKLSDYHILLLRPENLPPCYSYLRIDPYCSDSIPNPVLGYWTKKNGNLWHEREDCMPIK